jgi:SAM-dependent methyltransferase
VVLGDRVVTIISTRQEISPMSSHVSNTWYDDFFTELPNEFWRRAVPAEATVADITFVASRLGLSPASHVLDVPCGSGRHALELAARGHHVTGIDLSAEAIAHARRQARISGLSPTFIRADMRALPDQPTFDAAICMGNSFGYLGIAETRVFVARLAAAIRPGGGLVIDFGAAAESILPSYTGVERTMDTGDIRVTATNAYDVVASRLVNTYRFTRGSEEVSISALHYIYTCAQLGEFLTDVGFGGLEYFADTDGTPFTMGAGRLLVTARR